ncbi:MAG: SMC family ATPase [Oscillospiraceae bacterium]|nr:SMC family ATPase [Oscillospiraceae bacterium]
MRPIWLEMTAFGSYAEKTRVPFDELRSGLYLVTGDTGAGKTTIFDAIAFALFGEASGSVRTADMMHCDLVDKSVDTVVTLCFAQNGREHVVTRTIHFPKRRGESGYGDRQVNARLQEPDRDPIEGAERVSRRVEAILGLNAGQFRKIVMLAQGEFRVFLSAESDKKAEILGKLFDNTLYVRYQEALAAARDELQRRRVAQREELGMLLKSSLRLPESMDEETRLRFLPDAPELLRDLDGLAEDLATSLAETARQRDDAGARMSELDARKGAAEAVNAQLDALAAAKMHLEALDGQAQSVQDRRERLERADAAFQIAMPRVDAFRRAQRALATTRGELERLERERALCDEALAAAEAACAGDETDRSRILALETELGAIDGQIQGLRERERLQTEQLRARVAAEQTGARLAERERSAREQELVRDELRERLDALEDADALALRCQNEKEKADADLAELLQLREELRRLCRDEASLEKEQEQLRRATEEALSAEEGHHRLYQSFLAGQAGLMAEDLRRELAVRGEAVCPVCASRLDWSRAGDLAPILEGTPDKASLDRAKEAAQSAEQRRAAQYTRTETCRARLQSGRSAALEKAARLLPGLESWEQLADGTELDAAEAARREQALAAQKALDRARVQLRQRGEDRQRLSGTEQALDRTRREIETCTKQQQEVLARIQTLEALLAEAEKGLLFPTEQAAMDRKTALGRERDWLQRELEQRRRTLESARSRRDTLAGGLREKSALAQRQQQEQSDAQEALTQALRAAGFADAAEAEAALAPLGGADPLVWLRRERKALDDYENDRRNTAREIAHLEQQLQGKSYTDLQELSRQRREIDAAFSELNTAWSRLERQLQDLRALREQAAALRGALAGSESAWRRLDRLGSLAVGVAGDGGKLSFDRYVIGAVFREVLEMADRRMDVMSGGKYQLVHRSSADRRNAKAGLDIQVLDLDTGQLRGVDSLSGGETFFTSLALALGLSDVVQAHAGGRGMDALFIDEGFGSLSDDVLDKALNVLDQLSGGQRLVGIISHVDKLDESIPQKIRVRHGKHGSTLSLELA